MFGPSVSTNKFFLPTILMYYFEEKVNLFYCMNISDHISNQRHYLKVMLRCARMYQSQIEKPSIKNCHKLIDFRHCFYRCVSLYRSSVFNISKRLKAFFPWKNVQKISRNRSLTLCIQRVLSSQCIIHCLYWFVCNTHYRSIYPF